MADRVFLASGGRAFRAWRTRLTVVYWDQRGAGRLQPSARKFPEGRSRQGVAPRYTLSNAQGGAAPSHDISAARLRALRIGPKEGPHVSATPQSRACRYKTRQLAGAHLALSRRAQHALGKNQ